MIVRTIFRALWAATVFVFAVVVALGVLFVLGALWVGDELRAAAPHDPMLRHGAASVFGLVLFVSTVTPALPAGQYMTIFAAAGFVGGFIYWLLAGARA